MTSPAPVVSAAAPAAAPTPTLPRENPLHPTRLWQLVATPGRFFSPDFRFSPLATAFVAWFVTLTTGFDRLSRNHLKADVSNALGTSAPSLSVTWGEAWMTAAIGAIVAGAFYYYLGGFWYGLRLRWSGVKYADPYGVRELNTYVELITSVPYLIEVIASMILYATFTEYWSQGWEYTPLVLLAFTLLGVTVSYRGAKARYGLASTAGLFWFLLLPAARVPIAIALFFFMRDGGIEDLLRGVLAARE